MNWAQGAALLFSGGPLLYVFLGSFTGVLLGSLPGLGPVFVLTLILPLTLHAPALDALVMLVAGYTSAVFGGAITAVVFNVPGHPGNVATTFEGPIMAKQGRAGEAVVAIGVAGAIGGLVATGVLIFVSPLIVNAALSLQPVDYFMLALFGLSMVAAASRGRVLAGIMLGGVGVLISTIGPDIVTGTYRFTFGSAFLRSNGVPIALVAVGVFAIGSGIVMMEESWRATKTAVPKVSLRGGIGTGLRAVVRHPVSVARSSLVGVVMGVIPGLGITLSNLAAYGVEKWFGRRSTWKTGNVVGVIAPEAADSATLIAELVPAFTLGIPGAATSALILAALALHGIQTGPGFFQSGSPVTAGMLLSMPVSQVVIAALGILIAPIVVWTARIPQQVVGPTIVIVGAVGAYAVTGTVTDVVVALLFGFVGYCILKLHLPLAPIVMGTVLGPLAEKNFQRVQILDNATHRVAYFQPMALVLGALCVVAFSTPLLAPLWRRHKAEPQEPVQPADAHSTAETVPSRASDAL